jgi:hypothetical protein
MLPPLGGAHLREFPRYRCDVNSTIARVATASCLTMILAPGVVRSEPISTPEAGWAAITKCAALADEDARHACSDDVLRDAGLLPAKSTERRKRFGLQRQPDRSAPPAANVSEQLEVTLARVEQSGDGKLVLTTTDGAVWRQVESDAIRPAPAQGQTMSISKTSFGGFMCEARKRIAFRCFRLR